MRCRSQGRCNSADADRKQQERHLLRQWCRQPRIPVDEDMQDAEVTSADGPAGSSDRKVLSPDRRPPAMDSELILAIGPGACNERRIRTPARQPPSQGRATAGDILTHNDEPATKKSIIDDPGKDIDIGDLEFAAQSGIMPGVIGGQPEDRVSFAQRCTMPGVVGCSGSST